MATATRERRARRNSKIKKHDELYDTLGVDPSLVVDQNIVSEVGVDIEEVISYESRNRRKKRPLAMVDYDYQAMAIEYSMENVPQQLGNYRNAMDFLAHTNLIDNDKIVDRLKSIIYNFPNIDMSSFLNKENAKLYSWICQHLSYTLGEKYIGSVYVLGGGMGLLGAMLLDTRLRFENIRSFDINGAGQFLADELMADELLMDWRFKSTTKDLFDIDYARNLFSCRLQNGSLSDPFKEIPGTVINTNISYLKNHKDWYEMIPDLRRMVIVGETGDDVPYPFASSQAFNKKFPMSYELYTGVLNVGKKQFFMKIGHR